MLVVVHVQTAKIISVWSFKETLSAEATYTGSKLLPANSVPLWRKFLEIAAFWLYFNALSMLVYGLDP